MNSLQIEGIRPGARVHFIGIGGVHMRAHAEQLHNSGYIVSGSDQNASDATEHLQSLGVTVFTGHKAEHVTDGTDLVVYTAAVPPENPELLAARAKGVPVMERAALLGGIMRNYAHPVCVAGTHGKTTATSMLAEIFLAAELDPTIAVGGVLPKIGGTFRDGGRDAFIVEACEYCDSFLQFHPYIGIVLNVEFDHADYFADLDAYYRSFRQFAERIPAEGALVVNTEVERLAYLTGGLACRIITVDGAAADVRAENIKYDKQGCAGFIVVRQGERMGKIQLDVPGRHNVSNALAALAAALDLGVPFADAADGLEEFTGVGRRAEIKGETPAGATVMDDYAHHPTEIRASLAAMQNGAYNRVCCIFQPHTRSRTLALLEEFTACFDDADTVVLLDIYEPAGREEHDCHVSSADLAARLAARGVNVYYAKNRSDAVLFVHKNFLHNDLCITMGAGDVSAWGKDLLS